jgi:hypothetical protein
MKTAYAEAARREILEQVRDHPTPLLDALLNDPESLTTAIPTPEETVNVSNPPDYIDQAKETPLPTNDPAIEPFVACPRDIDFESYIPDRSVSSEASTDMWSRSTLSRDFLNSEKDRIGQTSVYSGEDRTGTIPQKSYCEFADFDFEKFIFDARNDVFY